MLRPAWHGTRGGWKPCGWLTARQLELSRLGPRVRPERTPRPGARARLGPVTLADRPSRVPPVPGSDHGRSATVVVMLRGSQLRACPGGRCDGQPAQGRDASGWPGPRADPWAAQRRRRGTGPRPGTPESVTAKPARLSLIPGHAHPRSMTNFEPARPVRSMTRIWQPDSGNPGHISLGNGRSPSVCGGMGRSGSYRG